MKRPRDMTREELEALPERDLARLHEIGATWHEEDEPVTFVDRQGVGWFLHQYRDGTWYKARA
jgi:hypothetical protein